MRVGSETIERFCHLFVQAHSSAHITFLLSFHLLLVPGLVPHSRTRINPL